jgi:hypothetical protein
MYMFMYICIYTYPYIYIHSISPYAGNIDVVETACTNTVSSSAVRALVHKHKSIQYLVPHVREEPVWMIFIMCVCMHVYERCVCMCECCACIVVDWYMHLRTLHTHTHTQVVGDYIDEHKLYTTLEA